MSNRIVTRFAGLIGLVCAVASAASATSLGYSVVQSESNVFARASLTSTIDIDPDPTNTLPFTEPLRGSSNTMPSNQSHVTAETGLPDAFNNGANGIVFSELTIHSFNVPGTLVGTSSVPVPLGVTGSPVLFVTMTASLTDLKIMLNAPLSSTLTPSANPNEWLWAGLADVTISGTIEPNVVVSAVPGGLVPVPTQPFSQAAQLPLFGTFSGVPGGTRINVGIDTDAFQDQDLSLDPINVPLSIPPLFTLNLDLDTLILEDISTSIVYQNLSAPIPEPNTALLLGLGLVGLALRRSR